MLNFNSTRYTKYLSESKLYPWVDDIPVATTLLGKENHMMLKSIQAQCEQEEANMSPPSTSSLPNNTQSIIWT